MLYDGFEIQKVGEYPDPNDSGKTFCEPIFDPILEDGVEPLKIFWTIYGHLPEGGVEALIDQDDEDDATEIYEFFCDMLKSHVMVTDFLKKWRKL